MPWSVKQNPSLDIIEEMFTGLVTASELIAATSQRISLQKETGITRILNDVSEIDLVAPITTIYDFPAKHYNEEDVDRDTRMALIMPKDNKAREMAEFFITASKNRGWVVVAFEERQSGIDWLLNKTGDASPS